MGDRIDREEEEIPSVDDSKKPFFNFFDFNKILGELLRFIIYAVIFIIIFFLFFDNYKAVDPISLINQIDEENQTLGEITIVGNEITLDDMLINTSDELENHFVKARIVISYGEAETGLEINRRMNQIYDRIRKVISSKKINELKYVDGQELLSLEIKTEIQKITGKVDIYNIFLRDFTVY